MFGLYVISFQVLTIVLFGVFIRIQTQAQSTASTTISQSFVLLLGYTLISIRYRLYDWTTITNLIFIAGITFQWNTLFYIFWTSCVNNSFQGTSALTNNIIIASIQAILCVIVTINSFLGKLNHLQMFVICLIEIIGFSLNTVIQSTQIKAVIGGGGVTIFLFAAVFSFCIKAFNFQTLKSTESFTYTSGVFKIIGLVLLVFSWPTFNRMGAQFDRINLSLDVDLQASAYYNTILALSTGIICSLTLQSYGNRVNLHKFIMNIFYTGVFISTCSGLIIDPFASLLLGVAAPIIALLYQLYGQILFFKGQPQYLTLFSLLSGIFSAIFAAGRAGRNPLLTNDPHKLGGLQLACLVVTLGFAAVFGIITAFTLKLFKGPKQSQFGLDDSVWVITNQMIPLYSHQTPFDDNTNIKPQKFDAINSSLRPSSIKS